MHSFGSETDSSYLFPKAWHDVGGSPVQSAPRLLHSATSDAAEALVVACDLDGVLRHVLIGTIAPVAAGPLLGSHAVHRL